MPEAQPSHHEIVLQTHNFNMPQSSIAKDSLVDLQDFLYDVRAPGEEDTPVFDGGFQVTPTRAIMGALRARQTGEFLGLVEAQDWYVDQPVFSSGEQSWSRGVVGGARYLAKEKGSNNGRIQFGGGVLLQEQRKSLEGLERLQSLHPDSEMPVVVYGGQWRTGGIADFKDHPFGRVSTQLHPELLQDMWGLDLSDSGVYKQLSVRLQNQSIDGVTVDPVHLWRSHDNAAGIRMDYEEILDVIDRQKVPISDLHVGLARADRKGLDRIQSFEEMVALIKSPASFAATESGKILQTAVEIWYGQNKGNLSVPLRAVVEMPYSGLAEMGLVGSDEAFYDANRVVADHLRAFLETTLASEQARNPHDTSL